MAWAEHYTHAIMHRSWSPALVFHWTCFSLRAYPVVSCMVIRGFDWNEGVSQTMSAPVDCEQVGGTSVLLSEVSARRPAFQG